LTAINGGFVTERSLLHHVRQQWDALCPLGGVDPSTSGALLADLLGETGRRPVALGPASPSDIADDHCPIEYSVAFQPGRPTLRVLAEAQPTGDLTGPGLDTDYDFLRRRRGHPGFTTERLDRVWDVFATDRPQGLFGMWHSLVFRDGTPEFKIYLNPELQGVDAAYGLVERAMDRLGMRDALPALLRGAIRPGELGRGDRLAFFALDLHDAPHTRVKLYVAHHGADLSDVRRAASIVDGVDPDAVAGFVRHAGGRTCFDRRPLMSAYTLAPGADRPVGYSMYVPIRDYVTDDEEARHRLLGLLERRSFPGAAEDAERAIAAVAGRRLDEGRGLIAHLSLRSGKPFPGVSAYLSAEPYSVLPPRPSSPVLPLRSSPHRVRSHPMPVDAQDMLPPYRIKVVEPIPFLDAGQRRDAFETAGYNPFNLRADQVTVDLLSDSGTGATSAAQEAAAQLGDESYAGARSWFRFRDEVTDLTGYPHVLPVHQGRAAERVLFSTLFKPGQICVSNTHFDTTHANVQMAGAEPLDLPCPEAMDLEAPGGFKGNIDVDALKRLLAGPDGSRVGLVLMTITNNGLGAQPVSMANLEAVRRVCNDFRVPFLLDAARFAENAWLVREREAGYGDWTPREIATKAFQLADGCLISLKKDGLSAIGGLIGLKDPDLFARCEVNLIATEGFSTYGGLAGHDLERLAQGLREVVEPAYLRSRANSTRRFADLLGDVGVPIVQPAGIHAIYLNAGKLLPHLSPDVFPGHALACQLYLDGGVRCAELGSLYLGKTDENFNLVTPAPFELVRLAIPRRVYTDAHLEYVAAVLEDIAKEPERVTGYRITSAPAVLRHFKIRLEPAR
jgi:tryptophanase